VLYIGQESDSNDEGMHSVPLARTACFFAVLGEATGQHQLLLGGILESAVLVDILVAMGGQFHFFAGFHLWLGQLLFLTRRQLHHLSCLGYFFLSLLEG